MDIKEIAILIFKLIVKAIGFICLGIGFLALYIPIVILIKGISEIGLVIKSAFFPSSSDPSLKGAFLEMMPLTDEFKEKRRKERESRQWAVDPLKKFFMKQYQRLKNW